MSGHGAMTSQRNKVRPFLREIADYCTLEGDIDHHNALKPSAEGQVSDLG